MENLTHIFEIQYTKAAEKFFTVHEDVRIKYEEAVKSLMFGEHHESVDVKRIKGKRSIYYRIRLGEWRVIYTIIDGRIIVVITLLAGARGDVYKKAGSLR